MTKIFQKNKKSIATISFLFLINVFLFHSFTLRIFEIISVGFLVYLFFTIQKKSKLSWKDYDVWAIIILIILMWVSMIFRSYAFIRMVSMAVVTISTMHLIYLLSLNKPEYKSFLELCISPLKALNYYFKAFGSPKEINNLKDKPSLGKIWPILIGLIIGMPVVMILLGLFSSDPIFGSKLDAFKDWIREINFSKQVLLRGFLTSLIFFFISPFKKFVKNKRKIYSFKKISSISVATAITTVAGLITITLISFIIIQWPYIFANVSTEVDLSQFGVATYSEYVTKGMTELLAASSIIYLVGWVNLIVLRERSGKKTLVLSIIQSLLMSSFLILLASVFRRLWLYQAHHGLSLVRIYGGLLLVSITVFAVTLIARHWKKNIRWVRIELMGSIALLIFIGLFNAQKFIAVNNPPTVNNRVDYIYLSRMSSDAIGGWEKSYVWAKEVIEKGDGGDGFIDKEERRDLAYAGSILRNLISEKIQLELEYGDDENLFDLYDMLIQHKFEIFENVSSDSEIIYSKPEQKEILNKVQEHFSSLIEDSITPITSYLEENRESGSLNRIKIDNAVLYQKNVKIIYDPYNYCDYSTSGCMHPWYAFGMYLSDEDEENKDKGDDSFENFLEYNWSNSRAYINTKNTVPLDDLLSNFRGFVKLHMQVIAQPKDQWDYDHDISLKSPLL